MTQSKLSIKLTPCAAGGGHRLIQLCLGTIMALPVLVFAQNSESGPQVAMLQFNTRFLQNGGAGVDLNDFLQGSLVVAGVYRVDLLVNRNLSGRRGVSFRKNAVNGKVDACLTLEILESIGLDLKVLRQAGKIGDATPDTCYELPSLIEQSSVEYDPSRMQLIISVPQAAMSRSARGYVDPQLWDEGVTAGFVDYNFTGRSNHQQDDKSKSYYLGVRNGVNLGPWRLRNESAFTSGTNNGSQLKSDRTFVERDITSLKSQLALGTTYSSSQTFDSVRLKGGTLASDDSMLPDSQRGYAPTIRGDAETNATVEVRQNGYLLSSTNVAPGLFLIDDVYPNGSNGDLHVTVVEADGRRREFTQTFASLPQMVRRGKVRYNLAAGQYDSNYDQDVSPFVAVGGLAYGLTDDTTLLSGLQWAPQFHAVNLGVTQNTFLGALSADVTQSSSETHGKSSTSRDPKTLNTGQSLRLLYAKTLSATDTTFSLASYRYSTDGYRTLSDHVADNRDSWKSISRGQTRSRFDLTLSQSLGNRQNGSLYLNTSEMRYWNMPGKSQQYQVGYDNSWRSVSYNIGATRVSNPDQMDSEDQTRVMLSLSFPLGSGSRAPRSLSSFSSSDGNQSLQSGINGNLAGRDDAYYSVQAGHDEAAGTTGSATLSGLTPAARMDVGYTQGKNFKAANVGAAGSIVAHAGGINLGQSLGENFTLVDVPDSPGTRFTNHTGVTTGANGYAVLPAVQPYRANWITLDARNLGSDTEIDNPTQQVIPRRGSVTVARFAVKSGRRVQFELLRADGSRMPFGASVGTAEGEHLAISDPTGRALILVEELQGTLTVKSGGTICHAPYSLPETEHAAGYENIKLVCR